MASLTADREVEVAGERLLLLPEKAAFWPAARTLFAADVHLGKAAAFRAASLPIPAGTSEDALRTLGAALRRTASQRLVLLGDLWHAQAGRTEGEVCSLAHWREEHADVAMTLVQGNHDLRSGRLPVELGIQETEEPLLNGPFALRHYPEPTSEAYTLAGHLHPAVTLDGAGGQSLRLPCFWFGEQVGVLPALGVFTGSASVVPRRGDKVFVVAEGRVLHVGG